MSTYLEMYNDALRKIIDDGGSEAEVNAAVDQYNAFDQDAFARWLTTVDKATCASCGVAFKPPEKIVSAEVLCEKHAPK